MRFFKMSTWHNELYVVFSNTLHTYICRYVWVISEAVWVTGTADKNYQSKGSEELN